MKTITTFILLVIASIGLQGCQKENTTSEGSTDQYEKSKQVDSYWTCSMHPQIHKDAPGKCPICGMDLTKVEPQNSAVKNSENFPSGHGQIQLSTEKQEMIGMKTGVVEKKEIFKSIDTAGRVAFDPELYSAQNEYIEAVKQEVSVRNSPISDVRHSARSMVESSRTRLKILGLSDSQISALKSSSNVGGSYLIPKLGERLWIYAEVYEVDLQYIQPKLKASISGRSLGGKTVIGEVVSVDRIINPTTRTAKVRISLDQAPIELRPESYVDVSILSPLGEQLVVPFDAIFDTGKEAWVFVVKNSNAIEPRKTFIRSYAGDEVAISSGLKEGDKIVTSANFLIDSESRLIGTREELIQAAPSCPEGKIWNDQMKHCM